MAAIPFERFMAEALYHPERGYYMQAVSPLGREGDFVTAPEMTSLFGQLLTLQCIEVWELLGRPQPFTVVEVGPGSGKLAVDLLATADRFPAFAQALRLRLVEISPALRQRQRQRLAGQLARVAWLEEVGQAAPLTGVVLANELLDAMPVHWVEQTEEGLRELWVEEGPEGWRTFLQPPRPPLSGDYFQVRGVVLTPGYRTEVGLAGQAWWRSAAGVVERGALLALDYGYAGEEYYTAARCDGTLMGHYRHQPVMDPLAHAGQMDLTAHVDFSAIAEVGEAAGMQTWGYTTQGWFLLGLGLLERLAQVARQLPEAEALALKQTAMRLVLPEGMGERFKVLVQGRGLTAPALSGFRLNDVKGRLFPHRT